MNEDKQRLINAIPSTGEVLYSALNADLQSQGADGRNALKYFHRMRRSGEITVRTVITETGLDMYVSRATS